MTKDEKLIDYEVESKDRQFYLEIDGKTIYVTEEVYRAYMQPIWAEKKRKEREARCSISNGKGSIKRCMEDCSICQHPKRGIPLSLDKFYEDSQYEVADEYQNSLDRLIEDEFNEKLRQAILELKPLDQQIINLFSLNNSEREIAKEVGLSQKTVNNRKNKAFEILREKMKKYR